MDTLACILYLYPTAVLYRDFTLLNTAGTVTIDQWLSTTLAEPTTDQLNTAWATVQLQQANTAQLAILTASYQAAATAPVSALGTTFPGDLNTRALIGQAYLAYSIAGAVPSGFFLSDTNNNQVPATLAELGALCTEYAAQVNNAFQKMASLTAQLQAATTVAGKQAVTW